MIPGVHISNFTPPLSANVSLDEGPNQRIWKDFAKKLLSDNTWVINPQTSMSETDCEQLILEKLNKAYFFKGIFHLYFPTPNSRINFILPVAKTSIASIKQEIGRIANVNPSELKITFKGRIARDESTESLIDAFNLNGWGAEVLVVRI